MNFKKKIRDATFKEGIVFIALIIAMIFLAVNHASVVSILSEIYAIVKPFIYGLFLAFVFHIPMNFFMKKLPSQFNGRMRRLCAALLTLIAMLILITVLLWILLPMIIDNIMMLVNNYDSYIHEAESFLNQFSSQLGVSQDIVETMTQIISQFSTQIMDTLKSMLPTLINILSSIVSSIKNIVFACLIAIYLIVFKDTLLRQGNRVLRVFLDEKKFDKTIEVFRMILHTFTSFITGQGIEALIIGLLCYIGCKILNFEYAAIVSVIMGVTNVIPIFGAIIGVGLGAVIIALVNPLQGLIFLIFGICLQQFESNLIYPHVVGSSVGLPPLWVLFAVTFGGGLFGVMGMVLGLPAFSVIYELFRQYVLAREKKKEKSAGSMSWLHHDE